jgi:YbgC/YbaW family acyl-CoA thioester hydrolase
MIIDFFESIKVKINKDVIDHYNHVNHGKYSDIFESAQKEFLKKRNASFGKIFDEFELRIVQRVFHIEFIKPLYLGDCVIVCTKLETSGKTSFVFNQIIKKDDFIVTECRTVYVVIDINNNKIHMPDELRKRLKTN